MKRSLSFLLGLLFLANSLALAAPPKRVKQPVWNLSLSDGISFSSTMAPKAIKQVYMLADTTNVIEIAETEVYWWDITREYMADREKKEILKGKLEVLKNGKVFKTFERTSFSFESSYARIYEIQKLLTGEEAREAHKRYKERVDKYRQDYMEYSKKQAEYEKAMEEYMKNPKGEAPKAPKPPQGPNFYVTEPSEGFIVSLPRGNYQVRLVDSRGKVVPDTEKNVEVWEPLRQGIGYVARPESRWTMQRQSTDPGESLYAQGKETVYFSAFVQSQFNEFKYTKLSKLSQPDSGKGSQYVYKWRPMGAVPEDYKMEIIFNGKLLKTVPLEHFTVEQIPGPNLGYNIVKAKDAEEATFTAYEVPVEKQGTYILRLRDNYGNIVPGSTRVLQSIPKVNPWPVYVMALLPVFWGVYTIRMRRKIKQV